ncbi:polysaccharide deacetylase family protein [Nonomuraea sp. NPDC049400]|uniref:polysaccharide deacetylase family protein n=1 Tax=Nonomuraea sp. NPDC049400 TaxID=3364352 RepID=UPI0037985AA1
MDVWGRSHAPFLAGAKRVTAGVLATASLVTLTAATGAAQAAARSGIRAAPPDTLGMAPSDRLGLVPSNALGVAPSDAMGVAPFEAAGVAPFEAMGDSATEARPRPRVDCRRVKCVALTFDDGPGRHTGTLLRHLAKYHARATFFVVGSSVVAYPRVLRRTVAAGHEIGNHTWSHPLLTRLSAARVRSQLARTDRAVKAAAGVVPRLVRPPYGGFNRAVRRQIARPIVMWNVDTLDWRYRNSATVARRTLRSVRPGSIVLFHDIHRTTVGAMPRVLKSLAKRGYHFVTVSELFGGRPPRVAFGAAPPKKH